MLNKTINTNESLVILFVFRISLRNIIILSKNKINSRIELEYGYMDKITIYNICVHLALCTYILYNVHSDGKVFRHNNYIDIENIEPPLTYLSSYMSLDTG